MTLVSELSRPPKSHLSVFNIFNIHFLSTYCTQHSSRQGDTAQNHGITPWMFHAKVGDTQYNKSSSGSGYHQEK